MYYPKVEKSFPGNFIFQNGKNLFKRSSFFESRIFPRETYFSKIEKSFPWKLIFSSLPISVAGLVKQATGEIIIQNWNFPGKYLHLWSSSPSLKRILAFISRTLERLSAELWSIYWPIFGAFIGRTFEHLSAELWSIYQPNFGAFVGRTLEHLSAVLWSVNRPINLGRKRSVLVRKSFILMLNSALKFIFRLN